MTTEASKKTTKKAKQILVDVTKLYTTIPEIDAAIVATNKKTRSIQLEYQKIAVSVLQHLGTHHDIQVLRRLFVSMENTALNLHSMKVWFDKYAPVSFLTEEREVNGITLTKGEVVYNGNKPVQMGFAVEKAWWLASPKNSYVPFNDVEMFKKFYESITDKAEKADPAKGDTVNPLLIQMLEEVYLEIVPQDTEVESTQDNISQEETVSEAA